MTDGKQPYEPPEVEEIATEANPAVTAAGGTQTGTYGAITLIDSDGETRMEQREEGSEDSETAD